MAGSPARRPRVVLLGGGSLLRPGGQSLRWRGLREALSRHALCTFRELGCDRWRRCHPACQLSGRPDGGTAVSHVDDDLVWYYDRTYCEPYAAQLAQELTAAGVSTVICSGMDTHRYVTALAGSPGLTVIFDMHNVELVLHRAIHEATLPGSHDRTVFSAEHLRLLEAAERAAVLAADVLWVCSAQDRTLIADLYDPTAPERTEVVPNVVPVPGTAAPASGCERVVFTGRMDYYPNTLAGWTLGYEIMPLVRDLGHDLPAVIAGALADEVLGGTGLPPGVQLLASPRSIVDLLTGGIMTVPLTIGGGTRFKIVEAFACGAPVVSTAKGAEGLDVVPGVHYLAAEGPAEFADAIDTLIRNPPLRARLGGAAWELARERYSIDTLARQLGELAPAGWSTHA